MMTIIDQGDRYADQRVHALTARPIFSSLSIVVGEAYVCVDGLHAIQGRRRVCKVWIGYGVVKMLLVFTSVGYIVMCSFLEGLWRGGRREKKGPPDYSCYILSAAYVFLEDVSFAV